MNKIKSTFLVLFIAVALGSSGCAQSTSQVRKTDNSEVKEQPIPPKFKDKVQEEFYLGHKLKIYDDVAWIGTDAIYAAGFKPKSGEKGGYVVEPMSKDHNGLYKLVFINKLNGHLKTIAYAIIKHDSGIGHVEGAKLLDPPQDLSTQARLLYQALVTAEEAPDLKSCKASYNTVVFPYVNKGKTEYRIYFLMSTKIKGDIPIGGHILVRVSADTKTVLQVKPLAKSCLIGQHEDSPSVAAIVFSDLALDSPSAAQVFLMWRYQKPIYMYTKNGMIWAIDSRGIRLIEAGSTKH